MRFHLFVSSALAVAGAATVMATSNQQPTISIDDDDITVRGCVSQLGIHAVDPAEVLVWSRSDIMLAGVTLPASDSQSAIGTTGLSGRPFYWLDDDEELSKHVGSAVEVKGKLEDFEVGEVKIDRDGDFIQIELDLDGKKETARVPTSWLRGVGVERDREFEIVARRVDVDELRVLGACRER